MNNSTHLVFDGKKVIISPDIIDIFNFLMEIEKEVESLLGFEKKLKNIRSDYLEILNFVQFLANKLKENNIDFKYNFSKHPSKLVDELKLHIPIRSQMIVLFANLEVLFCLNIAYLKQTDNKNDIRKYARDTKIVKKFLNRYCLTENNTWYRQNKNRSRKITSTKIRELRNTLTHFFSLSHGISVIPEILKEKASKLEKLLEKNGQKDTTFMSPDSLYEMIRGAVMLMLKEWNDDFNDNRQDFKQDIMFVQSVVKKSGAVVVQDKHLSIK